MLLPTVDLGVAVAFLQVPPIVARSQDSSERPPSQVDDSRQGNAPLESVVNGRKQRECAQMIMR